MTARELAVQRDRAARVVLARAGEVLPETDRRKVPSRRTVEMVERSPSSSGETHVDDSPLTAADLTADERRVFDRLWSDQLASTASVDLVEHLVFVARNNVRTRLRRDGAVS